MILTQQRLFRRRSYIVGVQSQIPTLAPRCPRRPKQGACGGRPGLQFLAQLLTSTDSLEAAQNAVCTKLKKKVCSLIIVQEEDLNLTKLIVSYGLESLVAAEIRNRIAKEISLRIQMLREIGGETWVR